MKIKLDATVKQIKAATFPEYTGRRFFLHVSEAPINCASYWDGGSRSYFRFVNLATMEASAQTPAQSGFDRTVKGLDAVELPVGFACVEHSIFCGRDGGITIHIRPENAAKLIGQGA